jgi:hypothetical protein
VVPDGRRFPIRKHRGHARQIAVTILRHLEERADGFLVGGDAVKVMPTSA